MAPWMSARAKGRSLSAPGTRACGPKHTPSFRGEGGGMQFDSKNDSKLRIFDILEDICENTKELLPKLA